MFREEITKRIDTFLLRNKADQLAVLYAIFTFALFVIGGIRYSFFVSFLPTLIFVAMLTLLSSHIFTMKFWLVVTFLLAYAIFEGWHDVANHHYVATYIALALLLTYSQPEEKRQQFIKKQSTYIFAIVMFFAGVQKLLAPGYAEGNVLEFMFLEGRSASFIMEYFFADEIAANQKVITNFGNTFVEDQTVSLAWYSPFFYAISRPLAGTIIIAEIVIGALALWFLNNRIFQVIVVVFAAGVFIVTPEGGFLTLLLILAWSQLPDKQRPIHRLYIFCFVLFLALLITRISVP